MPETPNLIGLSTTDADQACAELGLFMTIIGHRNTVSEKFVGDVCGQGPGPGITVGSGSIIYVETLVPEGVPTSILGPIGVYSSGSSGGSSGGNAGSTSANKGKQGQHSSSGTKKGDSNP
jgi:hypothetical protein